MAETRTVEELKKELEKVIDSCNMEVIDNILQILLVAMELKLRMNDEAAAKLKMAQDSGKKEELKTEGDGFDDQQALELKNPVAGESELKMAEDAGPKEEKLETGCDDQEGVKLAEDSGKTEELKTEGDGCDDQQALELKNPVAIESELKMAEDAEPKEEQLETGCDDQEGIKLLEDAAKLKNRVGVEFDQAYEGELEDLMKDPDDDCIEVKNQRAVKELKPKMNDKNQDDVESGLKMEEKTVMNQKEELETETEELVKDGDDDTDNATQTSRKGKSKLKLNDEKEELETVTEAPVKDGGDDTDNATQTSRKGKSKLKLNDEKEELETVMEAPVKDGGDDTDNATQTSCKRKSKLKLNDEKEELETVSEAPVKDGGDDTDNATQTLRKGKSKLKLNDEKEQLETVTEEPVKDATQTSRKGKSMLKSNPVAVESGQASDQKVSVQKIKYVHPIRPTRTGLGADPILTKDEAGKINLNLSSLLEKLPCCTDSEDIGVMEELQFLTNGNPYARELFGAFKQPINKLLNPTSVQRSHSNASLQTVMLRLVWIISDNYTNKRVILQECSETVPFLIACLRSQTNGTRRFAVMAIYRLSAEHSNTKIIGESGAIKILIELIEERDQSEAQRYAGKAIWYLCGENDKNREQAVSQGGVIAVVDKIKRRIHLDEMFEALDVLIWDEKAIAELEENGMLQCLFMILTEGVTEKIKEYCVVIIHSMCGGSVEKMKKINDVENGRQILEGVATTGTTTARKKAIELLSSLD